MKILLLLAACITALPLWACEGVQVSDGWIREAPPGSKVMAGYVTLKNTSSKPQSVSLVSSRSFGAIEIHQTVIENGASRMLALDTVEVPAHGEAQLAPGGMHLMLFRAKQPMKPGDRAQLSFRCGKNKPLRAEFTVKAAP